MVVEDGHKGAAAPETDGQEPELFLNGVITVVKRPDDYMAHVTGHTELWDVGKSSEEAVGSLVRIWPDKIVEALERLPQDS